MGGVVMGCAPAPESEPIAVTSRALLGDALPGLSTDEQADFDEGADVFNEVETVADGVGPVFNERACGNCHNVGAEGGSGVQFEVRAGHFDGTTFDNLTGEGGQLFDLFSVTSLPASERTTIPDCPLPPNGEPVPADANVQTLRRTTALFGLGLVEATLDATFEALAASQPVAIRGHAAHVPNLDVDPTGATSTVGKFGWKSQVPTLHQFSGDAYLNEMGITNPQFRFEQPPQGQNALIAPCDGNPVEPGGVEDDGDDVDAFTNFMRFLAPPPPPNITGQAHSGSQVFSDIGCDGCHVRDLTSGANDIGVLSNQTYHPYSDFLVHDMGSLADGIPGNGDVGRNEMRTAPLWGLHFVDPTNLLHDGSATSVTDAILRHDGQAAAARNAFIALPPGHKNNLLVFLSKL
ncbi:MAG TPA: di-heme oxidoredictase family protein [Burkholderiaceae bacterium]|nr:di-heme oxidoredictase family protein [Burkholderiaceae bacterium]